jgi:hypothetical protein
MRNTIWLSVGIIGVSVVAHGSEIRTADRAQVQGVVLLELMKDDRSVPVVVVDVPAQDLQAIMRTTPALRNKLISKEQFQAKYGSWKKAPLRGSEYSLRIETISASHATVMAGEPLIGVSGSQDRFILRKVWGKWTVVKRLRNQEMANLRQPFPKLCLLLNT